MIYLLLKLNIVKLTTLTKSVKHNFYLWSYSVDKTKMAPKSAIEQIKLIRGLLEI